MAEVVEIYSKNRESIYQYLESFLNRHNQIDDKSFQRYRFLQSAYKVDRNFQQVKAGFSRDGKIEEYITDKSNWFRNLELKDDMYISPPHIHLSSGKHSISVVRKVLDGYLVFDIDILKLLQELHLIEYSDFNRLVNRIFYGIGATSLILVSLLLVGFGIYKIGVIIFGLSDDFFSSVFKSVVSTTLGIAIYDLAKQILEHEVIFETIHHEEKLYGVLGKFLVSVIIALSIESMMVVFKIALNDYTQMLSALFLLLGISILLFVLGYFYKSVLKGQ
ncbi:MAG TPA: hypothetical protein EYO61_00635 [Campylobacterales bacterium]|nr:hypothetical protein [Campylobacterales bacterium]